LPSKIVRIEQFFFIKIAIASLAVLKDTAAHIGIAKQKIWQQKLFQLLIAS
jgi:hypothetical protein